MQTLCVACVVAAAAGAAVAGTYRLECQDLTLEFADEAAGLGLLRLTAHGQPLVAAPDPKPLLWRIELRSEDKALKPVVLDNRTPAKCSARARAGSLTLRWDAIALPNGAGTLSVSVRLTRKPGTSLSEWEIEADCRSKSYGVWDVFFPVMANVGPDARPDVAVSRGNWGMLYRECKDRQAGSYPSYQWPMQFLCVNRGESGLYLACHDPQAWPKRFSLNPLGEFHFQAPAPNRGLPGKAYKPPFPVVVGAYRGDWWQGAKLYRQWALAEATWTQKGPITKRKDTPRSLRELGLWMLGGGHAKEVVPKMHEAAKLFEVPIGIHWYNWHEIPFDTYYPNYFPTKPGFAEGVKELTGKGMVVMPYINGRLWDSGNENFKEAFPFACKTPDGKPYLEEYGSGRKLACMCPATPFWQKKVQEICERLMAECGVNAIYIDQIGAAAPQLCHDKSHGHPIGGGAHWVEGYREMLRPIMRMAHARGRDVIITTENDAEPYMDNLNAFLIWNPRYDNEIPMMTAVYSGHTVYFSSPSAVNDELRAFAASQGRDWLWGCQLGWMGFELLAPENRAKAEYLRELCKQRLAAAKFMVYGELLGEVKPLDPLPTIEVTWNRERAHKAVLPAAMATLWRAADGQLAVAMTNWDDSEHAFRYWLKEGAERLETLKPRQAFVRIVGAAP
ncbi:MAG: hypothetical protein FJ291_01460 [Planctomycetes bacterium]|nr:hypothetical protein [Planctomycetota bacterium]